MNESIEQCDDIFPQKMKEFREESGLNQKDIADKLGINRVTYIYYESGKRQPGYVFLRDFSKLSGWTPSYLLGLSEHRTLDQEADALQMQGDEKAIEASSLIRHTAINLLSRINKGEDDAPTYDVFLEPLARLCDQVNRIQKYISRYSIGEKTKIPLFIPSDLEQEIAALEIVKTAYQATHDVMKGFAIFIKERN